MIPKKLYKYYPLYHEPDSVVNRDDTGNNIICRKNQRKLLNLRNNAIWFSVFDKLNDPFEAQAVFFNTQHIQQITGESNAQINRMKAVYNFLTSGYVICSLTTNSYNSMPMWAHYANDHHGYCVEYEVNEDKYTDESLFSIDKVSYKEYRKSADSFIVDLMDSYKCMDENGIFPVSGCKINNEWLQTISSSYFTKHTSWSYENEWRILYLAVECGEYPNTYSDEIDNNLYRIRQNINSLCDNGGKIINLAEIGFSVSHIYIGMKCEEENIYQLNQISNELGCGNAYRITGRTENELYHLCAEQI